MPVSTKSPCEKRRDKKKTGKKEGRKRKILTVLRRNRHPHHPSLGIRHQLLNPVALPRVQLRNHLAQRAAAGNGEAQVLHRGLALDAKKAGNPRLLRLDATVERSRRGGGGGSRGDDGSGRSSLAALREAGLHSLRKGGESRLPPKLLHLLDARRPGGRAEGGVYVHLTVGEGGLLLDVGDVVVRVVDDVWGKKRVS